MVSNALTKVNPAGKHLHEINDKTTVFKLDFAHFLLTLAILVIWPITVVDFRRISAAWDILHGSCKTAQPMKFFYLKLLQRVIMATWQEARRFAKYFWFFPQNIFERNIP